MPLVPPNTGRPIIIGHRGARSKLPENTMESFELALTAGALGIETDLRFTKDGYLICYHDATIDRLTNSTGLLADIKLAQLKEIDIIHNTTTPHKIPTFNELLDWLPADIWLFLELKDEKFKSDYWTEKLAEMVSHYDIADRIALVSFKKENLASAKRVMPDYSRVFITYNNPSPNQSAEILGPLFPLLWLNPYYVKWAHKLGKLVAPLDPLPDRRMRSYLRWKVDAVLSDDPGKTIETIITIRNT